MLKKFIYGAVLTATLIGGASFFTSCKDTDEDQFIELKSQQVNLQAELERLQAALSQCSGNCSTEISRLNGLIEQLNKHFENNKDTWTEQQIRDLITPYINNLSSLYASKDAFDALDATVQQLQQKINNLSQCGCDLSGYVTIDQLNRMLTPEMQTLLAQLVGQSTALNALLGDQAALHSIAQNAAALNSMAGNAGVLNNLAGNYQQILDLLGKTDDIDDVISEIANLTGTNGTVTTIQNSVEELTEIINGKDGEAGLLGKINTLMGYFTKSDGSMYTVVDFQDAIAKAQWVSSNFASLEGVVEKAEAISVLNKDNLEALNNFLDKNTFDQLAGMYNTLFPTGISDDTPSYLDVVNQLKGLDETVAGHTRKFITVSDSLSILDSKIGNLDGKINDLTNKYKNVSDSLKNAYDDLGNIHNDITNLQNGLNNTNSKLDSIDAAHNDSLAAVNNRITDVDTRLAALVVTVADLTERVEANEKAIAALVNQVNGAFNRLNELVTGLVLQASTNSIIGNINTPFGVNSMVLMTYYGELSSNLRKFPSDWAEFDSKTEEGQHGYVIWDAIPNMTTMELENNRIAETDANGRVSLGQLWFTVNPGTVEGLNIQNFALVNSAETASPVTLNNVTKDDNTILKFGYSRAVGNGNGLYRADATVALEDLDKIKVNIEPGLVESLKELVNNRTITDAAHVVKQIYLQLQDICDANAIRYNYNATTGYDANGNAIKGEQKIYSQYGIAATAFKPIGFMALYDRSFRTLPEWPNFEFDSTLVDLKLKPFEIDSVELDVTIDVGEINVDPIGNVVVKYKYPVKFDKDGNAIEYAWDEVDITGDLQKVIDNVQTAIDQWLKGDGTDEHKGLEKTVQDAIAQAVDEAFNGEDGMVKKIQDQVNDMMGNIQGKLYDLVDQINTDYIGKINRVGSYYTRLANRINNVLRNPNHYLQAMMMYRTAGGSLARLSDNANQATVFRGKGEAIEMWATTYNFETICPVYYKFVGVTKVTYTADGKNIQDLTSTLGAAANNHDNLMAVPFPGHRAQVALDIKGANQKGTYTYEIAYQALDYTGHTSTNKYYIKVVRE